MKKKESESMIGRIVDMPLDEFEKELIKQNANIGVISNLRLNLIGVYGEFSDRKDNILQRILSGELKKEDKQVSDTLKGIYAEMTKIEEKVFYLSRKMKELSDLGDD